MKWDSEPLNGLTLEVLWGINVISRHDPFAKIHAKRGVIHFGAYSSRELMDEDEQIDMESWEWFEQGGAWAKRT